MDNLNACESELQEITDSEDYTTDVSDDKVCKEGESESLSDIDDAEVGSYLNNEKEKNFKKIIWDMMNRKYLQEQAAKRAAAAAGVTNPKRELRNKRAAGVKKTQSTAKIAHPTSPKKRPNSKINYDALSKALDEPSPSCNPPKRRREPDSDKIVGQSSVRTRVNEEATDETQEQENGWEDDPNYSHYNNQEEEYNYYDDDEFL